MNLNSENMSRLMRGITSLVCSRAMFVFFDDPEGPNLLIVTVAAVLVYAVSLFAYRFNISDSRKLLLAIFIQMLTVASLYFLLS